LKLTANENKKYANGTETGPYTDSMVWTPSRGEEEGRRREREKLRDCQGWS